MSLKAFDAEFAKAQAEKVFSLPVGMTSPLWLAYGGMTAGALTYWWMSQWMKPMNLEAMSWPKAPDLASLMQAPDEVAAVVEEMTPASILAAVEPIIEAAEIVMETTAEVVEKTPDDLTVLVGIGGQTRRSGRHHLCRHRRVERSGRRCIRQTIEAPRPHHPRRLDRTGQTIGRGLI